jgi:Spy/CpxP family protein refolding chaperone
VNNYWKVILATVVIFGAGVVTGGLLVRLARTPVPPPPSRGQLRPADPVSAGGLRLEFLRRAQRELELTADQRDRLGRILRESQDRTKKLMEPVAPQIREELRRTRAEFVEALTPEQRIRFNELARQQQQQQQQRARELRNTNSREAPLEAAPQ